jgi:hypothetical protein
MCTKRFVVSSLTALLLIVPTGLSGAQADPIEDPTGFLTSDNIAVHTVMPTPAAVGARFRGDYMYMTTLSGLWVYDVSSPLSPVLVGQHPLPHFENEDVDMGGDILLISNDAAESAGILHIFDIKDPANPVLVTSYNMNSTAAEAQLSGGPGHTASCILECAFAWVTDGGKLRVIDLRTPATPVTLGSFDTPAGAGAFPTHDVQVDENGLAWVSGFGGVAAYRLPEDYAAAVTAAAAPGGAGLTAYHASLLMVKTNENGRSTYDQLPADPAEWPGDFAGLGDGAKHNDFILHNSRRLLDSDVVYVTEEDYNRPGCAGAGSFETWRIPMREEVDAAGNVTKVITGEPMTPIDKWETELLTDGPDNPSGRPQATVMCSAHYFDIEQNVVAQAWYEQGVRLLDVSDPADIRQIAYVIPPNGESWAAYFPPTDPTGRAVYMLDASLGLVVLEYDRPTDGPTAMPVKQVPAGGVGEDGDVEEDDQAPQQGQPVGSHQNEDPKPEVSSGSSSNNATATEAQPKRKPCKARKTKKARRACRARRGGTSTSPAGTGGGKSYEPTVSAPVLARWFTEVPASAPSKQFGYACRIAL